MGFLTLHDDELALLRFTCDLFFVDESPLFFLEKSGREPQDYAGVYAELVRKGVVDPHGFRVTDDALNRIAPVCEPDARVTHLTYAPGGEVAQRDFYVLDDIAVPYRREGPRSAFGLDMDLAELCDHVARRLVPRKAMGDLFDFELDGGELLALARIGRALARPADPRLSRAHAAQLFADEAPARLPAGTSDPAHLSMLRVRAADAIASPGKGLGFVERPGWDASLRGLFKSEILLRDDEDHLRVRPGLLDLLGAIPGAQRDTFVRTDFAEDEWLVRETTLLQTDGGLFALAPTPRGRFRIRELDGEELRDALRGAIGRLPVLDDVPAPPPPRPRSPEGRSRGPG